ncbi:MAG: carbon-nitrogen hydrolase family protein [Sphingomonas fennica]
MRAALFQTTTGIDPEAAADALAGAIRDAAAQGADILFTPEMTNIVDRNATRADAHLADEAADRVLARARAEAAGTGLWVAIGSLAVRAGAGIANRSFLIDGFGHVRARYDKMHLFDVDLPTGERWRESDRYAAGTGAVAAETPWGRFGLSICYDLRFPALYAALAEAGATILAVPAAFTVPTGRAHWHTLLRARAIEAGAFVVAAAQTGTHADGRETFGHSLVVDPWGEVLLDMEKAPGVATVDLDMAVLADVRARIPALRHRRAIGAVTVAP